MMCVAHFIISGPSWGEGSKSVTCFFTFSFSLSFTLNFLSFTQNQFSLLLSLEQKLS